MIVILDYGVGNLRSLWNMIRRTGHDVTVTGDAATVGRASHIVLPGVGAFDAGMQRLDASGLRPLLERRVLEDTVQVLGVCLGMQMMTKGSAEGTVPGLGWVDATCERLAPGDGVKVPHMGWTPIDIPERSRLFPEPDEANRFYFLHSYAVHCHDADDVVAYATHGERFVAAFAHGNVAGVQFHPEKSHRYGLQLFTRWLTGA